MKLGILCAMEKEAAGLLERLDCRALDRMAGTALYALRSGHILCVGGVGKVNAALAAQLLIDRFQVDAILNPGCAGALTDLPVGTLVQATACVQHDVDTTLAGDPPGFVSTVERVDFPCRVVPLPGALRGVVATGDWFGRDLPRAAAIRETYSALVCDMEACAIAQVCLRNSIPFLAVKAVSDHLFSPAQDVEYQTNFQAAMALLTPAVAAIIRELED